MFNQLKTGLLLGILTGLLLLIGQLVGGFQGLTIGLVLALVMNVGSYWFSDKIVLMMYKAVPATPQQYPHLHKIVEELCHTAQLPKPKLYIIPTEQANAFATGRSPKHAAVACTEGILKLLTKEELKGVLAHEISHVKNRDILVTTIAATIAAVIGYVAFMARWAALFGGLGGRGGNQEGRGNVLELIVLAIVAPLTATLIQLAISRSREYLADETGAKTIKNGEHLAKALEKLHASVKHHPLGFGNAQTSSLFILNPFSAQGMMALFSTHPPHTERAKRLRSMKF